MEFTRSRADQIKFKYWGHTKKEFCGQVLIEAADFRSRMQKVVLEEPATAGKLDSAKPPYGGFVRE